MTGLDMANLEGKTVLSSDGSKIGKVTGMYLDSATNRPEWASVSTGMFGSKEALVPLSAARMGAGGELTVPFSKEQVKGAPHHDPEAELSPQAERELFDYYSIPYGGETVTAAGGPAAPAGGDDAMTRSEERLQVGTQTQESGRVRLRKRVVTENVTQTVPVSHEEIRVEREPITEANREAALSGPAITEAEHEVVLHEERPVVAKETVPVERVRVGTETVVEEQQVSEQVRKEQIEGENVDLPD